ncbi:MAG: beta-ketoacyl synthase chain length factor [Steroidobacteraceae bacterium]
MTRLGAHIEGIGLLGPGLEGWIRGAALLTDSATYTPQATVLPVPDGLPPAERRRMGRVVKLALAVGLEATSSAAADPVTLPAVFASSGADGNNCHEICQALALEERQLSPTRFHNSVHNAAAGYWSIATGATAPSNALCAFDASFTAGLLEALTQVQVHQTRVLLVAYDAQYPPPLHVKRPIPDAFGVGFVLAPQAGAGAIAQIAVSISDAPADRMSDPRFESLRKSIPAARSLPLLYRIARREPARVMLDYLDGRTVAVEVSCS